MDSEWAQALQSELNRLDSMLKQSTLLAIISNKMLGRPWDTEAFWKRPDTCARSTFNKWKKFDSVFVQVLASCWDIAQTYRNQEAVTAVSEAVDMLQLNAVEFVRTIVHIAQDGENDRVRLQAALGGLDRASQLTAVKSQTSPTLNMDDYQGIKDEATAELEVWEEKRKADTDVP